MIEAIVSMAIMTCGSPQLPVDKEGLVGREIRCIPFENAPTSRRTRRIEERLRNKRK